MDDLMNLLRRYPKLYTSYLLDPSVQPSGLCVPSNSMLNFRGDRTSFHEIDPAYCDGWLTAEPGENRVNVFQSAQVLDMLLHHSAVLQTPTTAKIQLSQGPPCLCAKLQCENTYEGV